jgi:hypothetical protein
MYTTCDRCGSAVDWVDTPVAASVLGVSERRVRELLKEGRFPGAERGRPRRGTSFWKIPLASLVAYQESRRNS